MSDLQCPARILLVRPGLDDADLAALADREHVVRTITGADVDLDVDLDEVADLHRGETVMVVVDTGPHVDRGADAVLVEVDADGRRLTELALPARDAGLG